MRLVHSLVLYGSTIVEKRRRRVLPVDPYDRFSVCRFPVPHDRLAAAVHPVATLPLWSCWLVNWLVLLYCIVGRDGAVPGVLFGPYDCL